MRSIDSASPDLRDLIGSGARAVLAEGRILGGVALVEDAYHSTMTVKVLKANEIADEEPALLDLARKNMPRLPIKHGRRARHR